MTDDGGKITDEDQHKVAPEEYVGCGEVRPGTLGYQRCWRFRGHGWMHESQDGQEWTQIADVERLTTEDLRRWINEAMTERDIYGRLVARAVLADDEFRIAAHARSFGVAEAELERLRAEDKRRRGE